MERRRYNCSMCFYTTLRYAQLARHLVQNHRFDRRFSVRCGEEACGATYQNWNSYKKHLYRKHRNVLADEDMPNDDAQIFLDDGDVGEEALHAEEEANEGPFRLLCRHAAKFLLNIRDKCKTSTKAMFAMQEGVVQLVEVYIQTILREIHSNVIPGTQIVNVDVVREILEETLPFSQIFKEVETKTKLSHYLVNNLQMLIPYKVIMGTEWVWKKKPLDLIQQARHCYVVPFLPALSRLLRNQQVRHCVENPRPVGVKKKSIMDGKYFQTHPFFSTVRNALGIVLYYDELEVVNPLSSRTHKLGIFYWQLANIYPEYRSTVRSINLYAIVRYSYIVKFGIDKILDNLVTSLQTLQAEGITIDVNGVNKNYRGSLLAVAGDYPALGLVGGFKRSVNKTHKLCRRCLTSQADWRVNFRESQFTLRNLEMHVNNHVPIVTNETLSKEARQFWSKMYGVNSRSPLLDVVDFDVTKCLVQDIMHVISEGVLEVEMRNFIKYCVQQGFISLNELNNRMNFFNYGHMSRDKPVPVSADHLNEKLKQTASQMVCLGHILPFLLRDRLKGDDGIDDHNALDHLLCHVELLQIVNICFAFEITEEDLAFLRHQIEIFILHYKDLYPDTIVPKFHFLVHIPNQMVEFGPARSHFCMRFEAAHAWFRSTVPVVRNFKDMPWTLCNRYESLRCVELASLPRCQESVRFLYGGHDIKDGPSKKIRSLPHTNLLVNMLPNVDPQNTEVMVSPKVNVHGCTFQPDSIILVSCEEDLLPVFAKVASIYIHNSSIFLVYQTFDTEIYCPHLNAYEVNYRQFHEPCIMNIKDLIHPHTFSLFSFERKKYIVLFNHSRSESLL